MGNNMDELLLSRAVRRIQAIERRLTELELRYARHTRLHADFHDESE